MQRIDRQSGFRSHRGRSLPTVRLVDPPLTALQTMELQRMIEPSPQVAVFHRNHLTVAFPLPVVRPPFRDPVIQAAGYVGAGRHQCDSRRLVKSFQSAHDGQQFKAFTTDGGLGVGSFQVAPSFGGLQHESPIALSVAASAFGQEQKMRCGDRHRSSPASLAFGRGFQDGAATDQFCLSSQFAYMVHSSWCELPLLSARCAVTIGGVSNFDLLGTEFKSEAASLEEQLFKRFAVVEHRLTVAGKTYELRHPRSADELISEEEFNRDERLPYWAEIWPSAYVLAQRIAAESGEIDGRQRRLLELGCGSGLTVMTALAAGFAVTAVDYYPEALQFVRLNALLNGMPMPEVCVADWRHYPRDLIDFDVVIAADVLYERDYCHLVAAAFQQSLHQNGLGLLTDPQRTKAESLPAECRCAGLNIRKPRVFGPLSVPGGDPGVKQTVNLFEICHARK